MVLHFAWCAGCVSKCCLQTHSEQRPSTLALRAKIGQCCFNVELVFDLENNLFAKKLESVALFRLCVCESLF